MRMLEKFLNNTLIKRLQSWMLYVGGYFLILGSDAFVEERNICLARLLRCMHFTMLPTTAHRLYLEVVQDPLPNRTSKLAPWEISSCESRSNPLRVARYSRIAGPRSGSHMANSNTAWRYSSLLPAS